MDGQTFEGQGQEHQIPVEGGHHDAGQPAGGPEAGHEQVAPVRRLGRGLSALLGGDDQADAPRADAGRAEGSEPEAAAGAHGHEVGPIHVELIERNPYQPRKTFDEEGIAELAESITKHGLLQPLLVRPHNGSYQLIAGERRLMACKKVGLETVPCRVMELEDKQICAVAIEENLKRKDLNVLEKAQAFRNYLDQFGGTVDELAQTLSLSRPTVSNFIRLLDLAEPVKKALRNDKISAGHARALLSLEPADQAALCKRIADEGMTVRGVEAAVRELGGRPATVLFPTEGEPAAAEKEKTLDANVTNHVLSIAEDLRNRLGAKVEIKLKGKDAGRIVIDFASNDEFERIVHHLRSAA